MSDEGLHEIQLNGKQLVFLFMTATVVAVVIFLCGVMVGRGVQSPSNPVIASDGPIDPTITLDSSSPSLDSSTPVAASSPGTNASPSSSENLTYSDRLEDPTPVNEVLSAAPASVSTAKPAAKPAPANATAPSPVPTRVEPAKAVAASKVAVSSKPATAKPAAVEPPGSGFVVQVAAVRQRAEADTIQKRLAGKGYPAFISTPGTTGPSVFRVRVGKYESRREAESVAGRLEREEQFKPWITR